MDETQAKLVQCFQAVFPDLEPATIPAATQDSVAAWDSVATITLMNVIEDEFRVTMDLERMAEFTSFDAIRRQLEQAD